MLRSVFGKTLGDSLRAYPWWVGGLAAYMILLVMIFPMVEEEGEAFQELLESYPAALLAAFGIDTGTSIVTPEGFLATYVFGWMVPLLFLIYAITFATRAIPGEEDAGTMDLLLANPISRIRLVLEKFAALSLLMLGMAAVLYAAIFFGGLIVGWDVSLGRVAAACLSGALLGLAFGGITLAVGAATGKRSLTSGIAAGIAVASYLLFIAGGIVEWLTDAIRASPIWLYAGTETLINGLAWGKVTTLVLITAVFLTVAAGWFNRRDVRL